jgi:hypothetical protein
MNWFEAFEKKYQPVRPMISDRKARDQLDAALDIARKEGMAPGNFPSWL